MLTQFRHCASTVDIRGLKHCKFLLMILVFALSGCSDGTSHALCPGTVFSVSNKMAERIAAGWIEGLGDDGLVLTYESGEKASRTYSDSAIGRITKFRFEQNDWDVSIYFRGNLPNAISPELAQEELWQAVVYRVPSPGLKISGWDIRLMTPSSSFEEGIRILEVGEGRIRATIETEFFAVYGLMSSFNRQVQDIPSPEACVFEVRQAFPLHLTIEAEY